MSWPGVDAIDTMLAETGYSIPESELPQVADQIQHLEALVQGNEITELIPEASLSNPSDIGKWIHSLIELTEGTTGTLLPPPPPPPAAGGGGGGGGEDVVLDDICSSSVKQDCNGDCNMIQNTFPGVVMHHMMEESSERDSHEEEASGLRLVHLLLSCAACVEQPSESEAAEAMVNEISMLVTSMGSRAGAMGQVALYFAQALAQRIINSRSSFPYQNNSDELEDPELVEMLHKLFYHTCPYSQFAHFIANLAILEEFEGENAVHIVDLNPGFGLQWPPLIHMLAIRTTGPPILRITAISSMHDDQQRRLQLQHIGMKLTHLANKANVSFEYLMADDINSVQLHPGEAVAVNSMLHLHRLLYDGGLITGVLAKIRRLNPRIFTVVEQEASHNSDNFQKRFIEALHFYSAMFDSIDARDEQNVMASEAYLGREIRNIVACEGRERVERHERLEQWMNRMYSMGFRPWHLGSNAFNYAATLLSTFPGGGHTLQETAGCLTLGWQSRPLIAVSAWRC